jgi:hypothetical protein
MKKTTLAALIAAGALTALGAPATAYAYTADDGGSAKCNADWYVNPDETALQPKQLRGGLLFDGPSLIHHQTSGYTLKTVPTDGNFAAHVYAGARPLFKMETSNPYSTVNKSATGKWWSSKIAASEPGGQSNPVDSPADLIGKYTYTEATTVASFGLGYGNDTGNKALVTAVKFGSHVYRLACRPHHQPTPTPTSTDTGTPTPTPTTSTPGEAPAPTPVNSDLPVTG